MSTTFFFIWMILYFLLSTLACIVGAYVTSNWRWVLYPQKCLDIFKEEISKILFIKEYKYKYLSWYLRFALINCFLFAIFIWLWIDGSIVDSNINILLIIPFIAIFLLSFLILFILANKFLKQIKKIGIYSKKEAVAEFKKIQLKNENNGATNFALLKNNKPSIQDYPLQFQQRRYQKKIKKLQQKNLTEEKYNLKLLNLFITYLTVYGTFLTRSITITNATISIEGNTENNTLDSLSGVLIGNFFAFSKIEQK